MIGKKLGQYEVVEPLGEGGMATVYKGYDKRLDRDVAIKVILPGFSHSSSFLKRFEREAKSIAKLTHTHIVSVINYGFEDGIPYLVMAYVPGGTLKDLLGKQIPWQQAAGMLVPIARALEYAHSKNIIHRDIKPANFLVTHSGDLVISDFGIAKTLDEDLTKITGTGVSIGTPAYMSPEQGLHKTVDHRIDIYSLGIVFFEMITGRAPFEADTPFSVMMKHVTEPLPRPRDFIPDLPEDVVKVLYKSLEKDPKDRYQSMGEFAETLEKLWRAQEKQTVVKDSVQFKPKADEITNEMQSQAFPTREVHKKAEIRKPKNKKTRNFLYWGGGIVMVGVILTGLIFMDRQNDQNALDPTKTSHLVGQVAHTETPHIEPSPSLSPSITQALSVILPESTDTPTVTSLPPVTEIITQPTEVTTPLAIISSENVQNLFEIRQLNVSAYLDHVSSLVFNSEDNLVAGEHYGVKVVVVDPFSDQIRHEFNGVLKATSNDGNRIALYGDDSIEVWDTITGQQINTIDGSENSGFKFSPNGTMIADYGYDSFRCILWDVETGRYLYKFTGRCQGFSANEKKLATISENSTHNIMIWDLASGNTIGNISEPKVVDPPYASSVSSASFSQNGEVFTYEYWTYNREESSSYNITRVLDANTLANQYTLSGGYPIIDPTGELIATFGRFNIFLSSVDSGEVLYQIPGEMRGRRTTFSPGGDMIITPEYDGSINFLDISTGQYIFSIVFSIAEGEYLIPSLDFNENGTLFASGGSDGIIRLWGLAGGEQ